MVESPAGGGIPLMRLLLIEDERKLSAALCKLLQQEQYVVDAAYTGPQGLDAGLSGIYDAIILDVMLPGMDGFAVLSALRREGVTTPVLMLTARGDLDDRVRGLGLSIAQSIIQLHKGRIFVESDPASGTRFTAVLMDLE